MRIVIADDSLLVREGIVLLLRSAGIDVVAQTACAEDLLQEVERHVPDVALVDVRMPPSYDDEGVRAVSGLLARTHEEGRLRALTAREREVLHLVAEGRSNKGIAERLAISERAVQKHVTAIFGKFSLPAGEDDNRRILAVLAYLEPAAVRSRRDAARRPA